MDDPLVRATNQERGHSVRRQGTRQGRHPRPHLATDNKGMARTTPHTKFVKFRWNGLLPKKKKLLQFTQYEIDHLSSPTTITKIELINLPESLSPCGFHGELCQRIEEQLASILQNLF